MAKPETKPVKITAKVIQGVPALYSRAFFEQMLYASDMKADEFDAEFCLAQIRQMAGDDPVQALSDIGILDAGDVEITLEFLDEKTGGITKATWTSGDDDD